MSDPTVPIADDRLIVALDFGTTFSGVAYVYNIPGKKPDVVPVLEWPGEPTFSFVDYYCTGFTIQLPSIRTDCTGSEFEKGTTSGGLEMRAYVRHLALSSRFSRVSYLWLCYRSLSYEWFFF